jgi:hypothetical protein
MALGIKEGNIFVSYTIPLKTNDKEWTVNHLRYLADEIERTDKSIYEIKVGITRDYGSLELEFITFK